MLEHRWKYLYSSESYKSYSRTSSTQYSKESAQESSKHQRCPKMVWRIIHTINQNIEGAWTLLEIFVWNASKRVIKRVFNRASKQAFKRVVKRASKRVFSRASKQVTHPESPVARGLPWSPVVPHPPCPSIVVGCHLASVSLCASMASRRPPWPIIRQSEIRIIPMSFIITSCAEATHPSKRNSLNSSN